MGIGRIWRDQLIVRRIVVDVNAVCIVVNLTSSVCLGCVEDVLRTVKDALESDVHVTVVPENHDIYCR